MDVDFLKPLISVFQWEAFSLPELENFLRVLKREEEEYVDQIRAKYHLMKIHMRKRMEELAYLKTHGTKLPPNSWQPKKKASATKAAAATKEPAVPAAKEPKQAAPKSSSPVHSAKQKTARRGTPDGQETEKRDEQTAKTKKKDKEIFV